MLDQQKPHKFRHEIAEDEMFEHWRKQQLDEPSWREFAAWVVLICAVLVGVCAGLVWALS